MQAKVGYKIFLFIYIFVFFLHECYLQRRWKEVLIIPYYENLSCYWGCHFIARTVLSLQRQLFYYRNCFLQEFSQVSQCICSSIWNTLRNYLHIQWKTNVKCKELSRRSILIIKELTQLLLHIAVMIRPKVRSSLNAVNAAETNWLLTKCRNVPHTFFS